jgi:hypothetical protein
MLELYNLQLYIFFVAWGEKIHAQKTLHYAKLHFICEIRFLYNNMIMIILFLFFSFFFLFYFAYGMDMTF